MALFIPCDVKQPKPLTQFRTGMDEKLTFNEKQKKKEMEKGEGNQTKLMGEFLTRKKEIFIISVLVLTMLPDSA